MYQQQFDYEAVHIPGKTNAADYLSRHSLAATPSDEKASEMREEVVFYIDNRRTVNTSTSPPISE